MPFSFFAVVLLETSRYSYGWTLRVPPLFVWLDSYRPPGFHLVRFLKVLRFRMVALLEAPRYSYGWTLRGPRYTFG